MIRLFFEHVIFPNAATLKYKAITICWPYYIMLFYERSSYNLYQMSCNYVYDKRGQSGIITNKFTNNLEYLH